MSEEEIEELEPDAETEEEKEEDELSTFDLDPAPQAPLDVQNIPLDDIAELPNIRPAYHGIEGLAETIYVEGQLQPCLVRPTPPGADHDRPYELVFGYRRKRAIESLRENEDLEGWDTIRCEVREVNDNKDLSQMIVENMQREELSPVAEARAMLALKDSHDPPLSNAEVARRLGCDPSHVSHRIRMVSKLAIPAAPVEEIEEEIEEQGDPEAITVADDITEKSMNAVKVDEDEPETEEPAPKEKPRVDILELVDSGKISASGAEVIASLDERDDQEKLAELMIKNDWGVKKASKWVQDVKEHTLDEGSEEMGALEMATMEDVVEIPKLSLRKDFSEEDEQRTVLYALLRNGMDQEILDYLKEEMGYSYDSLWDYVRGLSIKNVKTLTTRYAVRYLTAAHRFHSLEPSLIDDFEDRDKSFDIPDIEDTLFEIEGGQDFE